MSNNMQTLHSYYKPLIPIVFPDYRGTQIYMHAFDLAHPWMPPRSEDYLPCVVALCRAANAYEGIAYLTVDEKLIEAGATQRRPGPHVDGCYTRDRWYHHEQVPRMPIIVAASIEGCKVWKGTFCAQPKNDGDLSHMQLPEGEILKPNFGYMLSADCIHESLPMAQTTHRSFLRIALPNNFYEVGGNE